LLLLRQYPPSSEATLASKHCLRKRRTEGLGTTERENGIVNILGLGLCNHGKNRKGKETLEANPSNIYPETEWKGLQKKEN